MVKRSGATEGHLTNREWEANRRGRSSMGKKRNVRSFSKKGVKERKRGHNSVFAGGKKRHKRLQPHSIGQGNGGGSFPLRRNFQITKGLSSAEGGATRERPPSTQDRC